MERQRTLGVSARRLRLVCSGMKRKARRALFLTIGVVSLGLGLVGAVLPVVPTLPFLLVAVWAFSKSSDRVEQWLLQRPKIGPRLREFRQFRVVPLTGKLVGWGAMAVSLGGMVVADTPWWVVAPLAALAVVAAIYLARCPGEVPDIGRPGPPPSPARPSP
jgi:uncharacterized protein